MKSITLLRHANAAVSSEDGSDRLRPLTEKGIKAIHATKPALLRAGLNPGLVLCSPATRCKQTLEHLARNDTLAGAFLQEEPRLYNASAAAVFDLLHDISDDYHSILVIGHNPAMQQLALALTGSGEETLIEALRANYPTFACAMLHFDITQWRDLCLSTGLLEHFVTPVVNYEGTSTGSAFFQADYSSI